MKKSLLTSTTTVLLVTSLLGGETFAEEDEAIEEIVVTGSRIARDSAVDAAGPVSVLGGERIRESGKSDIGELLRESPALNNTLPSSFSGIVGDETDALTTDSQVGLGLLDLRGLGNVRTLVLVNGRRHVGGGQGSAAVDVNSIPSLMVQRVETLTGGASSIYGADAVSGVVNFILRDGGDFDGLEFTAQTGISGDSDANETYLALAGGFEFADGRGELVFGIDGLSNSDVIEADRSFAGPNRGLDINNTPQIAALTGVDPNATRAFVRPTTNPISNAPGVFNIASEDSFGAVLDAANGVRDGIGVPNIPGTNIPVAQLIEQPFAGVPRAYNPGTAVANVSQAFGIGDGLQSVRQTLLPEQERYTVNLNGSFALTESMSIFLESKYAYSENKNIQNVDFNDGIPISYNNPFLSPALQTQIAELQEAGVIGPDPGDGSFYGFTAQRDSDDAQVMPGDDVERETVRIVLGLEGEIPVADGITYEVSYNYGRTDVNTNNINLRLEDRFYAAMDAVEDPTTGETVCRTNLDPNAVIPVSDFTFPYPAFSDPNAGGFTEAVSFTPGANSGCVPFNPLGFNSTTQAYADFVYVDAVDKSKLEQNVFLASLAGTTSAWFSLPGGAMGWAVGYEYREEKSEFIVNEFEGTGNTWDGSNGNAVSGIEGEFDVSEFFFEVQAPILADMNFAELLEVTFAGRLSDYSTAGKNESWSAGARYSPGWGLTLRGTWATAVRAPNIGELFSPQQPNFFAFQDDPCSIANINANANRARNCQQFVPDGYDINDFITAGIPGVTGGNPDLLPEEAETYTIGLVWEPEFILGLRLIVDYYETEIEGAIDALDVERIAEACVDLASTNNQFCPLIQRDPTFGFITDHRSGQINLGAFDVSGLDFGFNYSLESGIGSWLFGITGTHLLDFDEFQDPVDPTISTSRKGEFGYPEWIVNASINWNLDRFSLGWNGRFEDSQLLFGLTNAQFAGNPNFADPSQTGSAWVHDFNFNVDFTEKVRLYAGLNNAFDRKPYLGALTRPAGPRGRFGFLGLNVRI